jgi:Ferritin-like domain
MTDERRARTALEELDRDPSSRKRFLKAVGGVGAVGAFGVLIAACGGDDDENGGGGAAGTSTTPMGQDSGTAQFGEGDLGIAGYALTLEYLEADFYRQAGESGMLKGQVLEVAKQFGEEEAAHVQALEEMIRKAGGELPDKPKGQFPLDSQDAILDLAATVENLGAAAYLGQAPRIKDKEILAAALSIHAVEGRHAAILNQVTGQEITPDGAFAAPADAATVLDQVQQFIAS